MSISICWELVSPAKKHRLPGTSNDWDVFQEVFGNQPLGSGDRSKLIAMHLASGLQESLWGALAEVLDGLPEGSEIEVTGEY